MKKTKFKKDVGVCTVLGFNLYKKHTKEIKAKRRSKAFKKIKLFFKDFYRTTKKYFFIYCFLCTTTTALSAECNWNNIKHVVKIDNKTCKFNTREFILYKQGNNVKINNKCKIASGLWRCKYTGKLITATNQKEVSKMLQIDHVLPWHEMKIRGILENPSKCVAYNDLSNLVISSSKVNQQKSDWSIKPFDISKIQYFKRNHLSKNAFHKTVGKNHQYFFKAVSFAVCEKYKLKRCQDFK